MASVASLLNPEPPRAPLPSSRPSQFTLPPSRPTVAFTPGPSSDRPATRTANMQEHHRPARHTVRGMVNYPPFEDLDADSLREVQRFQVSNLRLIQSNCRRIPYHSQKKDFYQKTGRESFEVFEYSFKLPKDSPLRSDNTYTVMWDYNVGLVRMTPFFKCLEYGKTTPAKMLNQNPGLKDITHSITGGSIIAQGYWMPYSCAKAVCATFCHQIAGALIPIFGPSFLSECIREGMPGYKHMVIDPEIIAKARLEARRLLHLPTPRSGPLLSPRLSRSVSPRACPRLTGLTEPYNNRIDYDRLVLLSPHSNADQEFYAGSSDIYRRNMATDPASNRYGASIRPSMHLPVASSRWSSVNLPRPYPSYQSDPFSGGEQHRPQQQYRYQHPPRQPWSRSDLEDSPRGSGANPWLSAVPRLPSPYPQRDLRSPSVQSTAAKAYERPMHTLPPIRSLYQSLGTNKRTFGQIERPTSSLSTPAFGRRVGLSPCPKVRGFPPASRYLSPNVQPTRPALEADAALTLMQLCEKSSKQEQEHEREQKLKDGDMKSAARSERPNDDPKGEGSTSINSLVVSISSPACSSDGQTRVGSEDADLTMGKTSASSSPNASVAGVASSPNSLATKSPFFFDANDKDDENYNEEQSPRRRGRSKRRKFMSHCLDV
ncbi:hypothetical protein QBC36DRAFT_312465 [Triangularia setosa]|uniref:HTH APSES-type domain-containing protein n=1 Tax=Triangularia setosa TaxID=2587417 RepID=A0AAN7A5L7_9PEZI|nr:hypothetical protein QBC36DRAFT_312465 [Podospora setosa]